MPHVERFSSQPVLTTTEVADLLDVHTSSVKRWCNSGELPFHSTDGGHRRIHLMDVLELAGFREIETFLEPFHPYASHVWQAVTESAVEHRFERVVSLCLGWLDRGKMDRVSELLYVIGTHPAVPPTTFIDGALRQLMQRVGTDWMNGRIRAGDEHLMSNTVLETLFRIRREWAPARRIQDPADRPLALVGSIEGDQHHLGSMCIRLLLEHRGWRVRYLGPDVPVDEFANMQKSHAADLVCISFSPPMTGADMERCARVLGEMYDAESPYRLALGGSALADTEIPESAPFHDIGIFGGAEDFREWVEGWTPVTEEVA